MAYDGGISDSDISSGLENVNTKVIKLLEGLYKEKQNELEKMRSDLNANLDHMVGLNIVTNEQLIMDKVDESLIRTEITKLFTLLGNVRDYSDQITQYREVYNKSYDLMVKKTKDKHNLVLRGGVLIETIPEIHARMRDYDENYKNIINTLYDNINHIDTIKRYNMNSTIKDIESITKIIKGLVYFTALVLENITIIIDTQLLSKDPEHVSKDPEHVTKESEHVSKESNTNKYYIRGVRYITFADVIKIGAKCKELLKNNDNSQISLIRGVLMRVNKFVLRIRDLCNITPCVCIEVSHTKRSFIPFLLVQHLGQLFGAFD